MAERRIAISTGGVTVVALLNDSTTADILWEALPLTGTVRTWGDEIYFSVPVQAEESADARETVDRGDVAFWPPGQALCLFWGPTPMSRGDEIRPASPVNVLGRIEEEADVLATIPEGATITVNAVS